MHRDKRPWWQQATALVTVSTGGAITGFTFVPGAAATVTSPASVPLHLLALERAASSPSGQLPNARAVGGDSSTSVTADALLRSAIVNVAKYYLGLAQTRTPAQMETLIWDNTSLDGADHGPTCAAFASLTLELAAQAVGQQSWVTGGTSYPWPLPAWADVRVDENPASPGITSMVQDAEAHNRWHPLGDGYAPQPGDWVLFEQHVEIVTSYSGGVLDTIGADSEPHLTVNAHSFTGSLAADGVQGFIDNGNLQPLGTAVTGAATAGTGAGSGTGKAPAAGNGAAGSARPRSAPASGGAPRAGLADIPGLVQPPGLGADAPAVSAPSATPAPVPASRATAAAASVSPGAASGSARATGTNAGAVDGSGHGLAIIPGIVQPAVAVQSSASRPIAKPAASKTTSPYRKHSATASTTPATSTQQAFINLVAPGAMAGQQEYGVPAAVTIAQAIDESGWGQSELAAQYNNLFGIKGSGPAGSVTLPTSEYEGGQWVTIDAQFRVYHNVAESISDHDALLATSGYYVHAMADRGSPDSFANDLSGVYATDPNYGANLIALMKLYNLYRFDVPASSSSASQPTGTQPTAASHPPAAGHPATGHQPSSSSAEPDQHTGVATIPGLSAPALAPSWAGAPAASGTSVPAGSQAPGTASIPGLAVPGNVATDSPARPTPPVQPGTAGSTAGAARVPGITVPTVAVPTVAVPTVAVPTVAVPSTAATTAARTAGRATIVTTAWYQPELPSAVTTAYFATAKGALAHADGLYRDVAAVALIPWQVLAACDWMQCKAHPKYSPVQGEKLGAVNRDGTSFRTRSQALAQCAADLVTAAQAIYGVDLTTHQPLSVRSLADAFAAYRWGSLLRRHGVSAMEFPYSVAGLTARHTKMHWPDIDAPEAPDRPGARFREPFGAVPVVLSLGYPATV